MSLQDLKVGGVCLQAEERGKVTRLYNVGGSASSQNKHKRLCYKIWEHMNQTWEVPLHNILTTQSHLNHDVISQEFGVNI